MRYATSETGRRARLTETVMEIRALYDWARRRGHTWEMWRAPQDDDGRLPWVFYTSDPTAADTLEQARRAGARVLVTWWYDKGRGAQIDGCELV